MPADSFIRFDDAECQEWLPILQEIYSWESSRVSGPWAGREKSDIRNCTWTKPKMSEHLRSRLGDSFSEDSFDSLIVRMKEERQILEIINPEPRFETVDGCRVYYPRESTTYITRMAEMVRTIGSIHHYISKEDQGVDTHHQLIEGTKWIPRIRLRSPRIITKEDLLEKVRLQFSNTGSRLPNGSTIPDALEDLKLVLDSMHEEFNGLSLSQFQFDSITESIRNSWSNKPPHKALIITADTGAGKTLGFDIPAMVDALIENRMARNGGSRTGLSQLLLYPRNDLAKDQKATLEKYIGRINDTLVDVGREENAISLAIDAGGLVQTHIQFLPSRRNADRYKIEWDVCRDEPNVYLSSNQKYHGGGTANRPANIMVAGIESFRRRLSNPQVTQALRKNLRRVVLDEIHLSSGTQGAHHAFLLRRLQQICYRGDEGGLTFVGASATIAAPTMHTSRIWMCRESDVKHISSNDDFDSKQPSSLMNHILVRPKKTAPMEGSLADLTSLVGHQRRPPGFHERPARYSALQKTIGFADSHDTVGNWKDLVLENEGTARNFRIDPALIATHNVQMPYAHWFSRPLSLHPGGDAICDSCSRGRKAEEPIIIDSDNVTRIRISPNETLADADSFEMLALGEIESDTISVSGLDDCPYLQAGTCWHFAPRSSATVVTPGSTRDHSYRDVLRAKKHTSKSEDSGLDMSDNADHTFREKPRIGAYPQDPVRGDDQHSCKHDVVIATPTLEVGIDMSNVTEVVTHKAIRNVSSYRQKIGRGGRELGTDSVAATLMSLRASDFRHYRSTSRLIDRHTLEPVPIATNNKDVSRSEAYMAVLDWLSLNGSSIELAPKSQPGAQGWKGWSESLDSAINSLRSRRNDVTRHCRWATGNKLGDEDIGKSVDVLSSHLQALLRPYPTVEDPDMNIADLYTWISDAENNRPERRRDNSGRTIEQIKRLCDTILDDLANAERTFPGISDNLSVVVKIREHCGGNNFDDIIGLMEDVRQCIATVSTDYPEDDFDITIIIRGLRDLTSRIDQLSNAFSGEEIPELVTQIKALRPRIGTTYLSQVLCCNYFQKDSPFVMISSLFMNPYEHMVALHKCGQNGRYRTETTTAKEVLRFYLPGMWSFRQFGGNTVSRVRSGNLQGTPAQWVEHFRSDPDTSPGVETLGRMNGSELSRIPQALCADLHRESELPVLMRPSEVFFESPPPPPRGQGSQLVNMTQEGLIVGFDVQQGATGNLNRRPKAYSTTWDLSQLRDPSEVQTFLIPRMDDSFHTTFPVKRHPLMGKLFTNVTSGDIEVKRIATCVSRSNGVRIRFNHNSEPAVYFDKFTTPGIEFEVSDSIADKASKISRDWREMPFDTLALRALSAILEKHSSIDWSQRYAVESYVECLVQLAYESEFDFSPSNTLPESFGHFTDIITSTPLTDEIRRTRANHGLGDVISDNLFDDIAELHFMFLDESKSIIDSMGANLQEWIRETYCNTISLALQESASYFAGVPSEQISYSFLENPEGKWLIHLYDEDANGNGAMETVRDFFQIPVEVRDANEHFKRGILPTTDFVSEFERRMLTCQDHIAHSIAVGQHNEHPLVQEEIIDEKNQMISDYGKVWARLGISSVREASLHNVRRWFISDPDDANNLSIDYLRQSLELCDSGCPECNGDIFSNVFHGLLAEHYTCRSLVDRMAGLGPQDDGYLLKNSNESELAELAGTPIEPNLDLDFRPVEGTNGMTKRIVNHTSPIIGIHWDRNGENIDPDLLVRHKEAV